MKYLYRCKSIFKFIYNNFFYQIYNNFLFGWADICFRLGGVESGVVVEAAVVGVGGGVIRRV